jgi:hypothetical protein
MLFLLTINILLASASEGKVPVEGKPRSRIFLIVRITPFYPLSKE